MSKVVQTETLIRTYIREHHNFILRKDFNLMYIFTNYYNFLMCK